jgi:heat shock protein HslJ
MNGFARGMALMAAAALAACAPAMGGAGAPVLLAGSEWRLVELNGRAPITGPGGETPTLRFEASGPRASGNGGCNQFNGPYTQTGASLHFGPMASTRRACLNEAATRQETEYLEALHATTRISVADGRLSLYAGERAVARFTANGG